MKFSYIRTRKLMAVALLLSCAFLVTVQLRVLSYVCGNDPMLYMRAARTILSPAVYGADEIRRSLTFVAPGQIVFLAMAIKCFGALAPYWLNLVLLIAALPLLMSILRRLMGSDRAAAFSMLGILLITFSGNDLNAPYLLYPFREVPRMLFVYLAYFLLLKGINDRGIRPFQILGSSVALIAATLIREPSALILPSLALGAVLLAPQRRGKFIALGCTVLPWLTVAALGGILLLGRGLENVTQFSVLRYLGNHSVAFGRQKEMLGWFPDQFTWPGLVLVAVGMVRAFRSQKALLVLFVLPSLTFFVFYSYMHMHYRYFLTSVLFLSVFAGYGLDAVCRAIERLAEGRAWASKMRLAVTSVAAIALVAGLVFAADASDVWGPKVDSRQVRSWQALVEGLDPDTDGRIRIAVEQRCRYLEDMILSYTDAAVMDPKKMSDWPKDWNKIHYFRPLNSAAHYATPQWLMWLKIYAHRIMADRADLAAVEGGVPRIGKGEYAQYLLTPWRSGIHTQRFEVPEGDAVIWFDWGSCDASVERRVVVQSMPDRKVLKALGAAGNGLQALFLPQSGARNVELIVSSEAPLPSSPVIRVTRADEIEVFRYGVDRLISLNRMVLELDDAGQEEYSLTMRPGRKFRFRAPALLADDGCWAVTFSGRIEGDGSISLICTKPDGTSMVREVASRNGVCSIRVQGGETVELALVSSVHPSRGFWLVESIGFEYCTDQAGDKD